MSHLNLRFKISFDRWRPIATILIISLLALLITWPAFAHNYFSISWDGRIHLARFKQLSLALKAGHLPALISFWGLSQHLSAMSSMYPWLSSILFFWPQLIIENPLRALKVGFWTVNLLTGLNMYVLSGQFTRRWSLRLLAVTLYLFNMYHLILLYARVDLGEIIAYLFLPLVVLGCLKIWQSPQRLNSGWLWLALGMAGIANSHVLTLLVVVSVLIIAESWRGFHHQWTSTEWLALTLGGGTALLASAYSLVNIGYMIGHNHLLSPIKSLLATDPNAAFTALLSGQINENYQTWNLGIGLSILLLFLGLQRLLKPVSTTAWSKWFWLTLLLWGLTFSWWPYPLLVNTPLSLLQFPGRLLNLAALFGTLAVINYFATQPPRLRINWLLISLMSVLAFQAVYQFATTPLDPVTNPGRIQLTNANYETTAMNDSPLQIDYLPVAKGRTTTKMVTPKNVQLTVIKTDYDQITYQLKTSHAGRYRLPIAFYAGVKYQLRLNGHPVINRTPYRITQRLSAGTNKLTVKADAPQFSGITMVLSILTWLGLLAGLLWQHLHLSKKS